MVNNSIYEHEFAFETFQETTERSHFPTSEEVVAYFKLLMAFQILQQTVVPDIDSPKGIKTCRY